MPKIKINEASKGTNMISSGTVESHWTAAEVLANLSSAGGGPREEKFDNPISILQEEKTNIDPSTNERFPRTLWKVLADENNAKVIAWLPNGRGFSVHNRKKLINEVLPRYFKTKKYASFTRRLNRWGFGCFTKGQGTYVFHHPMFLRDSPELSLYMACNKKINNRRRSNHVESFINRSKHSISPSLVSQAECYCTKNDVYDKMKGLNRLRSLHLIQSLRSGIPRKSPLTLIGAYVASNDFFPELSSTRTKSIISNALHVLNQSDLKCLEMLQALNFSQFNRTELQNSGLEMNHGIRAYAA